jgi:hypothetical protein
MPARRKVAACAALGSVIAFAVHPSWRETAEAHGIAGNRLFPGTSAFDDPAVADELTIEAITRNHPAEDGNPVNDTSLAWSFLRLLTPDIAIGADNIIIQRGRPGFEEVTA